MLYNRNHDIMMIEDSGWDQEDACSQNDIKSDIMMTMLCEWRRWSCYVDDGITTNDFFTKIPKTL